MKHILSIVAIMAVATTASAQTTVIIKTEAPEPQPVVVEQPVVVVEQPAQTQVIVIEKEPEVVVVEKEGPSLLGVLGKALSPKPRHEPKHAPKPEPKKVVVVEKKPEPKKVMPPPPAPKKPEPKKDRRDEPGRR